MLLFILILFFPKISFAYLVFPVMLIKTLSGKIIGFVTPVSLHMRPVKKWSRWLVCRLFSLRNCSYEMVFPLNDLRRAFAPAFRPFP